MLDIVISLARRAGAATLQFYGQPLTVDRKADDSPLTQADLASHRLILAGLTVAFPDIPVVSEEDEAPKAVPLGTKRYWLVDPLDGTKEFLKQTGTFTVNVALIEDGRPVLGVIYVPVQGVTYWAARGEGAWKQVGAADPVRIATTEAGAALRFVASRDHAGPAVAALLERYPEATCLSIGSSLKFCLVAEGAADAYLRDVPTMEWDTGAAQAIVEEAGGAVLEFESGRSLGYGKSARRNGSLLTVGRHALREQLFPADVQPV